jgi:hypothetical protein
MAITTFEPGSDIALVGAVLPLAVAVGREGLVAAGAGVFIDGLAVDLIEMGVPPLIPAGVRAELCLFPAGDLHEGLSAAAAATHVRRFLFIRISGVSGEVIPAAEGRYLILRQAECLCDRGISVARVPEHFNLFFLFIGHKGYLQSLSTGGEMGGLTKGNKKSRLQAQSPQAATDQMRVV